MPKNIKISGHSWSRDHLKKTKLKAKLKIIVVVATMCIHRMPQGSLIDELQITEHGNAIAVQVKTPY